ncbi:hypothetical protein KCP69_10275 [Salmonella enterica subsp. enterica]|nr:hypothetical protein KCP69_10275 [Salmonella enterica subsp. enterica]
MCCRHHFATPFAPDITPTQPTPENDLKVQFVKDDGNLIWRWRLSAATTLNYVRGDSVPRKVPTASLNLPPKHRDKPITLLDNIPYTPGILTF